MGDTNDDLVVGLTQDQYERLLFRAGFALGMAQRAREGIDEDDYEALIAALRESAAILRDAGGMGNLPPADPPADPYAAVRARREPR